MSLIAYTGFSFLAASLVIGSAYQKSEGTVHFVNSLISSRFNFLVLLNLAYNILFLFGKAVQYFFFGKLRDVESKKIYDRLLQYVLFKFIFIGAIIEPEFIDLIIWIGWFSVLGFMRIFSLLTRDRFEYMTRFSGGTTGGNGGAGRSSVHQRLLLLLFSILLFDLAWFYFFVFVFEDLSILLLLTFECLTLFLETFQTLGKYVIHLMDLSREGVWEQRGTYIYYLEFVTDILVLIATLGHYIHILILHGISFTLLDALLFIHMRMVFNNLRERIVSYKNYRKLAQNMRDRYPEVPKEELEGLDDVCPICHDKFESAKKLPCGHIFHHSCLRSWLENNHNCPTCRYTLIDTGNQRVGPAPTEPNRNQRENQNEEIFRFNGPQWLRWLPSFQIVRNVQPGRHPFMHPRFQVPEEMIQRVQEILPQVPVSVIARDLAQTRSIELTIENLIHLNSDPVQSTPNPTDDSSPFNNVPVNSHSNLPTEQSIQEIDSSRILSNSPTPPDEESLVTSNSPSLTSPDSKQEESPTFRRRRILEAAERRQRSNNNITNQQ